jgi:hypothetical protein
MLRTPIPRKLYFARRIESGTDNSNETTVVVTANSNPLPSSPISMGLVMTLPNQYPFSFPSLKKPLLMLFITGNIKKTMMHKPNRKAKNTGIRRLTKEKTGFL